MRYLIGIIPTCLIGLTASACYANLSYNAEHDAALKNLTSVESANINMHFQCGKHSLIMSTFATQS
jgi:metal-sulfur cluster biosynthetic enzyme